MFTRVVMDLKILQIKIVLEKLFYNRVVTRVTLTLI